VGSSKGNILSALFGRKCWAKAERYYCKKHYYMAMNPNIYPELETLELPSSDD